MAEERFTKGEWIAFYPHEVLTSGHISVETEDGKLISQVEVYKSDIVEKTANAHLIAAAPEMYDELQELSNWLNSQLGMGDWHKDLEKLLAKARGKQ